MRGPAVIHTTIHTNYSKLKSKYCDLRHLVMFVCSKSYSCSENSWPLGAIFCNTIGKYIEFYNCKHEKSVSNIFEMTIKWKTKPLHILEFIGATSELILMVVWCTEFSSCVVWELFHNTTGFERDLIHWIQYVSSMY